MAYKITQESEGEKKIKSESFQKKLSVGPKTLPNTRQITHRIKDYDHTPLFPGSAKSSHRRILVVDDDEGIQNILSTILSTVGFEVVPVGSGTEGLNLFLKRPFDLVLTDFQMPGMDGGSLAFQIKKRSPDTPVVMITGHSKERVMEKIEGGCVDCVMSKPFRIVDILNTVKNVFDGRTTERRISEQ